MAGYTGQGIVGEEAVRFDPAVTRLSYACPCAPAVCPRLPRWTA
jgi:hypothetical protein